MSPLEALILDQQADDASRRRDRRRHRREVCASEINLDLDRFAHTTRVRLRHRDDGRPIEVDPATGLPWVFLTGCQPWERWAQDLVDADDALCPVCGEAPRDDEWCLYCHRTPAAWLPGMGVGEVMDPDYPAEQTSYEPGPLAGGLGRR